MANLYNNGYSLPGRLAYSNYPWLRNDLLGNNILQVPSQINGPQVTPQPQQQGQGMPSWLNGIVNTGASAIGTAIEGQNKSGIGQAMQQVGSLASNIPGVGGLVGAGVNLLGGVANAVFGSHINNAFVDETQKQAASQSNYESNATDNSSLMNDWENLHPLSNVVKSQVGSDGLFSHKARNKTNALNGEINDANDRAFASLMHTAGNVDQDNALNAMAGYAANGGFLSQMENNEFGWGGAINKAKAMIMQHEGWRDKPYQRNKDVPTIGYGFTDIGFKNRYKEGITKHYANGMTKAQANKELTWYLKNAANKLDSAYGRLLNDKQKAAVLDTYYQRPASVAKGSPFHLAVMRGDKNAKNYLGVAGYDSRNKDRAAMFTGHPGANIDFVNPANSTRVSHPVDYNVDKDDTPSKPILPLTGSIGNSPSLQDIFSSVSTPFNAASQNEVAQNPQDNTVAGIMNNYNNMYNSYFNDNILANGGKIHIKPSKRGTFRAQASRMGMSVQAAAAHILANKNKYSPAMRKKANFARNFAHGFGGTLAGIGAFGPTIAFGDIFAGGGKLNDSNQLNHGAVFSNGINDINEGGTHEQNPNGGVPVGSDGNGNPNLVEQGEVIYDNNYVFSNRLKVPKRIGNEFKLGGKMHTFADAAKKLSRNSNQRPNDPLAKKTMKSNMNKLMALQEAVRAQKMMKGKIPSDQNPQVQQLMQIPQNQPNVGLGAASMQQLMPQQHAKGGSLRGTHWLDNVLVTAPYIQKNYRLAQDNVPNRLFAGYNPYDSSQSLNPFTGIFSRQVPDRPFVGVNVPVYPQKNMASVKPNVEQENIPSQVGQRRVEDNGLPTFMRYAPIAGNALNMLANALTRPDYQNADAINDAAIKASQHVSLPTSPIGNYMQTRLFDPYYMTNTLNQNAAAANRVMASTGNRAQAMAGILANNASAQNNMAEAARQGYLANQQERMQAATFNKATDQYNSSMDMQRNQAEAQMNQQADNTRLNGLAKGYMMRQALDDQRNNAFSQNESSLLNGLGNMGWENEQRNWLNSLARAGVLKAMFNGNNGNIGYSGDTDQHKYGGRINRKKRRLV